MSKRDSGMDEMKEAVRGQLMWGLLGHGKDTVICSKCNGGDIEIIISRRMV